MAELEKVIETKEKKFLFRVETSNCHKDYLKYEKLREEVWGFPDDHLAGTRHMMSESLFYDGSSLYIAVFTETEGSGFSKQDRVHLVGFAYGFVGIKDKEVAFRSVDNLQFYSLFTAVRKDFLHFGLGILIKEFQREKLIDLFGIYTSVCTYDPLAGVNAYRNVHYFGMQAIEYKVDMYGEFGGYLNRADIPSDRLFMSWDLRKEIQRPVCNIESLFEGQQVVTEVEYTEIDGKSGPLELEIIKGVNLNLDQKFLLVEIPVDFYQMLAETDVKYKSVREIPLKWRKKTRQAFQNLFKRDYKIVDFRQIEKNNRKRDFYILKK